MVRELPEPIRSCTHVDMTEAYFSLEKAMAYVRGTMGTLDAEDVFVPDPDLKEVYVKWEGSEFVALAATLDGNAIVAAAQAKNWGFVNPASEDVSSSPETLE